MKFTHYFLQKTVIIIDDKIYIFEFTKYTK